MRLTSQIWVSALIRSQNAEGAFATVLRKGAPEAGAIFIVHNHPGAASSVYAPAPQAVFDAGEAGERRFECIADSMDEEEMRIYLDRQVDFDPDCWIIEIEGRDLPDFVTVVDSST